jgi:alpha-beta hydrolase superfamily lysophospholipase
VTAVATAPPATGAPRRRRRRWVVRIGIGVLVLLAALPLVLGWVFAGAVLAPEGQADRPLASSVLAAGGGSVVLADEPDARLTVVGLQTADGYWQLTGPARPASCPDGSGGCVERRTTVLAGSGSPAPGPARLDTAAWPDDPTVLGGARATIEGPDGDLPAWVFPARPQDGAPVRDTWVVYAHGRSASLAESLRFVDVLTAAGYPVLVTSHRGDGIAPDPAGGVGGFGTREWPDLDAAVAAALDRGAADVVLWGTSQGAALAARQLESGAHADAVRAVVYDSPLLGLEQTLELQAGNRGIPTALLRSTSVDAALWWAGLRGHLDAGAAEHADRAGSWDRPTLVLHGEQDDQVPVGISRRIAALADPDLVRVELLPGVGHVRGWNADPEGYEETVTGFLAGALAGT